MKPPLYALLIAPWHGMRNDILQGRKINSIRDGHRDYVADCPMMICCHLEPWAVMVDITKVRHTTYGEITADEYRADGFSSQEDMMRSMREFYPHIQLDSPVTVIWWANARGWLVDNVDAYDLGATYAYKRLARNLGVA